MNGNEKTQGEAACHYLLLLAAPSCRDGDEWLGIYHDDEGLREAYESALTELEKKKRNDKSYCSFGVEIWEFEPVPERDITLEGETRKESDDVCIIKGGQRILQIKPEELYHRE